MVEWIEKRNPDGSVEYVRKDIEELERIGREADAAITKPVFTPEQLAEIDLNQRKHEARDYLKNTDWYAARLAEQGTPIPEEVISKRQQARELLSS